MKYKPSTIDVTVRGLTVTAGYSAHKGFPGSREEPPEPAHCEVEYVEIEGVDMTQWLTDDFVDQVTTAVEEALIEDARSDYADPDDAYDYGDPKRSDFLGDY